VLKFYKVIRSFIILKRTRRSQFHV